jgi:protein arginine kinase
MILDHDYTALPAWLDDGGQDADVIISTRVRLARNLSSYLFPRSASLQERTDVFATVVRVCGELPQCSAFGVANFSALNPVAQQLLIEQRRASPELLSMEGDRGVIGDERGRTAIMVNEEDHLRLTAMGAGLCAQRLWQGVDELDTELGGRLDFAFDSTKGFLTSCPTNAGTGLRVSFLMHLVGLGLTKSIEPVLQGAAQSGMAARGFFGEHSEIVGNLFQISNQATMGAGEQEVLQSTEGHIARIVELERAARRRVLEEARPELNDKVYRAYGLLRYARTLSVREFLNLSSALRTGIECGLIDCMSVEELNRLTLTIMPAHLQSRFGVAEDERTLGALRSEVVRAFLHKRVLESDTQ